MESVQGSELSCQWQVLFSEEYGIFRNMEGVGCSIWKTITGITEQERKMKLVNIADEGAKYKWQLYDLSLSFLSCLYLKISS